MKEQDIVIIGAGIGGLTAALALQQQNFKVRLYEQVDNLAEVGAGLTLSPNANHALNFLGLEQRLAEASIIPRSGGVRHYQSGEMLVINDRSTTPRERYGADYLQIHRADLHAILKDAVLAHDPGCLHTGYKLKSLEQTANGVTAFFDNTEIVSCDVLVGCDGIHSKVRELIFGKDEPRFTGYIAWRGLVPTEILPPDIIIPDSAICTGPDQTFTRYAIRDGALLNYVAIAKRGGWEIESWSVHSDVAEVLNEFSDWSADVKQIIAATPADKLFKWALFDRDPLPHWNDGRTTLLGDAAHAMLPFLGQGAAMAIEDAVVLARAFANSDSITEALERYQKARHTRTSFVLQESRNNIKRLQRPDTAGYNQKTHKNEEKLGLFGYNPATVDV
ncbi:MAG: FAD-dependent monooxygenase [Gammaproteobacteria bacterium]|nr:FAD-dependent monooxygenase [Gammaproteobacteria bacterium]